MMSVWSCLIPQLWNHSGYLNAYTSFLGEKSKNTLGRCMSYLRSKNSFFTGVPFLILGRKEFNFQHSKDRTAGEKRKWKDAEEVLYIIFYFYLDLCVTVNYGLLIRKVKYTHEWVIWHWSQNTFMTNMITVQSWLNWRWFRS